MAKISNYNGKVMREMFHGGAKHNVETLADKQMAKFNEWLDSFEEPIDFEQINNMMWFDFDKVLDIVGEDDDDSIVEDVVYSLSEEDCRRIAEEEEMEDEWGIICDTLA